MAAGGRAESMGFAPSGGVIWAQMQGFQGQMLEIKLVYQLTRSFIRFLKKLVDAH